MEYKSVWLASGKENIPDVNNRDVSSVDLWRAVNGASWRAYSYSNTPPSDKAAWIGLAPLLDLQGSSRGEVATHHYVVETDISAHNLEEFTAWYDTEHMPGLARVPGTVRARRFKRQEGTPRFIACYDLTTPLTLEHPEWLAVRHTPWSDRVRPMFCDTVRTMYIRAHLHTS